MSNLAVSAGEMATDDAGHDLVGVSESPHEYESDHELLLIEAEDQVCAIVPGQHVTTRIATPLMTLPTRRKQMMSRPTWCKVLSG